MPEGVVHDDVAHEQHTWEKPGPLGLRLQQRGGSAEAAAGVVVSKVDLPGHLEGVVMDGSAVAPVVVTAPAVPAAGEGTGSVVGGTEVSGDMMNDELSAAE